MYKRTNNKSSSLSRYIRNDDNSSKKNNKELTAIRTVEQEGTPPKKYVAVADDEAAECMNLEYLLSDYATKKKTAYGEVFYSHRYNDGAYVYRHVRLKRGVRAQAELLASKRPNGLLYEDDIVGTLGIDMTSGWEHYMLFKGSLNEIILRKPLANVKNENTSDDGEVHTGDEVSENSAEECEDG